MESEKQWEMDGEPKDERVQATIKTIKRGRREKTKKKKGRLERR
jgi:hypothetical protein